MTEFFHIMFLPFCASLILCGIHVYLGMHVVERQVIFADLALAQIAVLGASLGILFGKDADSELSYGLSLGLTIVGAGIFSLTRFKRQRIPQEAIIGITYVVAAALLLIILSFSGEGDQHIRESLSGNILLVGKDEVLKIFIIYALAGFFHFLFYDKFYLISANPTLAFSKGINVRLWDFLFYASFGLVVTSSVKIAGVLLVFSLLIIPAVCAVLLTDNVRRRLMVGWGIGVLGSVMGILFSYYGDFPTGASIVCSLAAILIITSLISRFFYH